MQLILPIFPQNTKFISSKLGVFENDGIVHYIANGLPVYAHPVDNINSFRFITSNFIEQGLCKGSEVARCFGIPENSVAYQLNIFRKKGANAFFSRGKNDKKSHKLHGELLLRIQRELDKGLSNNAIAKKEGISEGTIRYALSTGTLKKNSI
ncbi:MAG: response regulator transcription factor [Pseudarcicella sp.]|nr:response regulator transcription factor [Pseudarcicella sp.]